MKSNTSMLLATGLVAATTVAVFFSLRHAKDKNSSAALSTGRAAPAVRVVEPTAQDVQPAVVSERRTTGLPKTAQASPATLPVPDGISPEDWQKATAIASLMSSLGGGEAITAGNLMETAQIESLLSALGLNQDGMQTVSELIAARNEKMKEAGKKIMEQLTKDPRTMTEMVALSLMSGQQPLNESQQARLDQLEHEQEELMNGTDMMNARSWYEDQDFMNSLRAKLSTDEASRLDDYAEEQRSMSNEKKAFDDSQQMAEKLGLNSDQRQAVFDVYRQNPEAGDEQILPLLNDAQKEAFRKNKSQKSSISISVSGKAN